MTTDVMTRDLPAMCLRSFGFEVRAAGGDGRTLEGYAAVFNSPTRIADWGGDFDEEIAPGAFARSLEQRTPVLQFEHGRDPRVGAVPIGTVQAVSEDSQGLHVRARLFSNPTVEPVREAIAEGAITGMSFRFQVPTGGDTWQKRASDVDLRRITQADVSELGPVVFPAYDTTSVGVRSLLAGMDADERHHLIRELVAELRLAPDLTDLIGRPSARSAGGDDPGSRPGHGGAPALTPQQRAETDALRLLGILK